MKLTIDELEELEQTIEFISNILGTQQQVPMELTQKNKYLTIKFSVERNNKK